jgi:hypothetical protein
MALTSSEVKEIEVLVRKEIKNFMTVNTIKQFEDKLMDQIAKGNKDVDAVINSLGQRIFRGGLLTIQMSAITYKGFTTAGMALVAGTSHALNFFGPYKWIFGACIYTA